MHCPGKMADCLHAYTTRPRCHLHRRADYVTVGGKGCNACAHIAGPGAEYFVFGQKHKWTMICAHNRVQAGSAVWD